MTTFELPPAHLASPVRPLPIDDHLHRHTAMPMVTATHRNGLAEVKPYRWHRGEAERGSSHQGRDRGRQGGGSITMGGHSR